MDDTMCACLGIPTKLLRMMHMHGAACSTLQLLRKRIPGCFMVTSCLRTVEAFFTAWGRTTIWRSVWLSPALSEPYVVNLFGCTDVCLL